ncbi:RimK family alpha-L-glutamate ligase [Candidatus Woesearchaeota archaeon]|jgi:ribosomal protein S6--L-glutamate ligase|nr:RimK family alpha-L-glutamate ligase [Candidatus Woesearchaeota archaeon]MBT5273113.1 RimK family alpha-L-glutamate ligase [Candidatus Woesearchaeota archaeon]MBT6040785.1 RimK family alpha-L-glutamate ligase [Candidatus Woesearchaeota archaeon]MBT6337572.1 RimK family alpha-L-glutamate ligase [Candidatus Woesearchaeota archaeon]MBT7927027.1 RimK family alpha-L-glutamate ligase [Candidatus Woesearchaeota archaeon]
MKIKKPKVSMNAAVISLGSVSSKWTLEAMEKYFDKVDKIDIRELEVKLGGKKIEVLYKNEPLGEYDCIYAKGSHKYAQILRAITAAYSKSCYMPIVSSAFTLGHNKLLTQMKLQELGIPMPLAYLTPTTAAAKKLLKAINYPIVMKFPEGTHGKGVMFADSFASANSMLDALTTLNQPFIIQEYVETGGSDIRAFVIGDKVVASIERKADVEEKRANIHSGGSAEPIELDSHTKKIAVRASQALGCGISGVDLLLGVKGPMIIEINLSPGLQGISKATNLNIADKIAKHLYENAAKLKLERESKVKTSDILNECGIDTDFDAPKEIITNLSIRGKRIVLPEIITNLSDFDEKNEVVIHAKKGRVIINKF